MEEIVDARDVLDANARSRRAFQARVLGYFRRTGPNRWDPYEFVAAEGDEIEVLPGLKVEVEPEGAVFRIRSEGKVLRAEWLPTDTERPEDGSDLRARFMKSCVGSHRNPPGRGVKAWIARKLRK